MTSYPPPPPPPPPPYPPDPPPGGATSTNGFAIASLVLGIVGCTCVGWILALVFGYVGKSQIDQSGGLERGRGMAIAGIVLGYVWGAITVVWFVVDLVLETTW